MIRLCESGHPPVRLPSGRRCPACARKREAMRPSFRQRGYDTAFDQARRRLVASLPLSCAYGCGTVLYTTRDLIGAHLRDGDPTSPIIPSCRSCNERAKVRA